MKPLMVYIANLFGGVVEVSSYTIHAGMTDKMESLVALAKVLIALFRFINEIFFKNKDIADAIKKEWEHVVTFCSLVIVLWFLLFSNYLLAVTDVRYVTVQQDKQTVVSERDTLKKEVENLKREVFDLRTTLTYERGKKR